MGKQNLIAELHVRASHVGGAPSQVNLPIPENLVITRPYIDHRPSVRTTGKPMFYLTLSNKFGSPGATWFCTLLHIHVVINWQLSKQGIRLPVSLTVSRAQISRSSTFLKLSAEKLLVFKWSQAQIYFFLIHMKYVVFMSLWSHTLSIKILISNWPRARKFNQLFKNAGGEDFFLPWSTVGHALRPIFMCWLVKTWHVSSRGKFIQHY